MKWELGQFVTDSKNGNRAQIIELFEDSAVIQYKNGMCPQVFFTDLIPDESTNKPNGIEQKKKEMEEFNLKIQELLVKNKISVVHNGNYLSVQDYKYENNILTLLSIPDRRESQPETIEPGKGKWSDAGVIEFVEFCDNYYHSVELGIWINNDGAPFNDDASERFTTRRLMEKFRGQFKPTPSPEKREEGIDLKKLEQKFDKLFETETAESFEEWIKLKPDGMQGEKPEENAYMLIVGSQTLTKKHAIDMFKVGVCVGKEGNVEIIMNPSFQIKPTTQPQASKDRSKGLAKWNDSKSFPKSAYKYFVIRYVYPENNGWEYDVIHTSKIPVHLTSKTWQWLSEFNEPYDWSLLNELAKKEAQLTQQQSVNSSLVEWEIFCDLSYYDLWAVRPIGCKDFNSEYLFHLPSKDEAERLRIYLSSIPSTINQKTDEKDH